MILLDFRSHQGDVMKQLIERVQKTQHGFLDIQKAADEVFADHTVKESLQLAGLLLDSDIYQARSLATFILGRAAAESKESLRILKKRVSRDKDWRVQEILAKAFDRFCADTGYEDALPIIREWLGDTNPNVRRAVTEGLRIWTGRPYFREHPEVAIGLLSSLKEDESDYVRKSVGNALRDISKKYEALIRNELSTWELRDNKIRQTHKLASRFLKKTL